MWGFGVCIYERARSMKEWQTVVGHDPPRVQQVNTDVRAAGTLDREQFLYFEHWKIGLAKKFGPANGKFGLPTVENGEISLGTQRFSCMQLFLISGKCRCTELRVYGGVPYLYDTYIHTHTHILFRCELSGPPRSILKQQQQHVR